MLEFTDKEILDLDILAVKQIYACGAQLEELRKGAVGTETAVRIEMIERWKAETEAIHTKLQQIIHNRNKHKEFCNQLQKL